ncbi:MAG: hypothetical protein EHM41_16480 [Chloroflexi bacterium]|nr:MAG: hypothetical protein EHM41_16480 [Chloroflexota bacterium]
MYPSTSFRSMLYNRIMAVLARPLLKKSTNPVLALGLVIGVFVLTGVLAFKGSNDQLVLVLLAIAGGIGTLILNRWQSMGLVFLLIAGMALPYSGNNKINLSMIIVTWMLFLWLMDGITRRHNFHIIASKIVRPLLALLVVSVISFGVGQLSWFSFVKNAPLDAQLAGLAIIILAAGTFLLAAENIQDIRWLKLITWLFVVFGTVYMAGRLIPGLSSFVQNIMRGRISGGVFSAWFPAITFSQAVFNRELKLRWRLLLGIFCIATLYYGLVLRFEWKSYWLPGIAAVFAIILAREWRIGFGLGILGLVTIWFMSETFISTDEYSLSTRLEGWLIIFQIIKQNPFLGLGFGNYYYYTALFPIRGWYVVFNSHNNYVDIIAQIGLLGFLFFGWFFWGLGRLGWELKTRVPDGFPRAYIYGAFGGLVGTLAAGMLGDWILPFVYNLGLQTLPISLLSWMFLGGLLAIKKIYSSKDFHAEIRRSA